MRHQPQVALKPETGMVVEMMLALGLSVLALMLRLLLDPFLGDHLPYATFFISAAVAAYYVGLGASVLAVIAGGLASAWFFMPPRHSLLVEGAAERIGFAMYFAVSLTIVGFGHALRRARRHAESVTDRLQREAAERKQAEHALRASEERFARFMQYLPGLAWIKDGAGRYLFVNDAAETAFQRARDQLCGKTDAEIFSPETARQFMDNDKRVLDTHNAIETIETLELKDGLHHSLVNKFPIPASQDHPVMIGGIAIDITEHRRAEQALRDSEERFRLATETGQVGVWEWNIAHNAITWTDSLYAIHGITPGAMPMTVEAFGTLVHPDDRTRVEQAIHESVTTGAPYELEFRVMRPDGTVVWIFTHAVVVRRDGQPHRMVGATVDISQSKRITEQLQRWNVELEQRVDERTAELQDSQRQLRALATELSLAEQRERKRVATELHDHLAQLLVLGRLKVGQAKQLPGLAPPCTLLIAEIEEVLSASLAYTRTLVADLNPPVLHEFGLVAALRWLGEQMRRHDMDVTVDTDGKDNLDIPEDQAVLLFQSVRELLMNASKHAGCGTAGVTLTLTPRELHLTVMDDGRGFDPSATPGGHVAQEAGPKFGLFSIRERMKALGGRFELRSSPGEGTTATLVLPHAAQVDGAGQTRGGAKIAPGPGGHMALTTGSIDTPDRFSKIRVLLVDDHAMVRQGLRSMLNSCTDVEVVGEAGNGEDAVVMAETLRPAVVVMDINMPGMNGLEATRHIKHRAPQIAVIGLSVNANVENQEAMSAAGAALLLTKEAAAERLYLAIQQAVRPGLGG